MTQDHNRGRWAVSAVFSVNGFFMGSWAPQIPLLLPRYSITEGVLGLLIMVMGIGAIVAMIFTGRLIAAFGAKRMTTVFALLLTPTLPAIVYAPSLWVLVPLLAFAGAVVGCMDVSMNANAVAVEQKLGRAIMSSCHGFWSLGGFVGGILGGEIIAAVGAERHALFFTAVSLAVVLVSIRFLAEEPRQPAASRAAEPKADLFPRDAALWILGLMALFSMVPEGAVLDWAALYLSKDLGSDVSTSGYAFGFFAGTMAIVRFAGDRVRNRFGAVRTLRVSALVAAAGMMAAALAPVDWVAIACFAVCGLGVANMVPIMFSAAGNHPGLSAGAGIAAVSMAGYTGILFAPSTIGFVAEYVGYRWTYGVLALILVVVSFMADRVSAADGRAAPQPA